MFTPTLDTASSTPLYMQLYEYIRCAISDGIIAPNEHLPSKRRLAAHLKLSVITIETAYSQLMAEGYIYSKPQSGYYANDISSAIPTPEHNIPELSENTEDFHLPYEFRTNSIDTTSFPFSIWARLMREVLRDNDIELLKKGSPMGLYRLRYEISLYLKAYRNIKATPEQIVVGAGSEYLINIIIQLLGCGKIYAVENPGYHKIASILSANNITTRFIAMDKNGIDCNKLNKSDASVVHITPSHHFPLGIVTPVKRRNEILAWAYNNDCYIIEDDYDSEFRYAGRPIPALQSLDNGNRVIYLNTFAKNLAPSLRISYMVLPPPLAKKYNSKLYFYSNTVSSFEQYTLSLFMAGGHFERYVNRMRLIYKERLDTILSCIENSSLNRLVTVSGDKVGLHVLIIVNNGMNEDELVNTAAKRGVLVNGMTQYYYRGEPKQPTVILGYAGIDKENIKKAFKELEIAWS
jgi:GntR family transcriptional regulator/MocR family aminotransferase